MEVNKLEGSVNASLPDSVDDYRGRLGLQKGDTSDRVVVGAFLRRHINPKFKPALQQEELQYKCQMLDNVKKVKTDGFNKRKLRGLTCKERKKLKLYKPQAENQKYSMYIQMHEMWLDYMRSIINVKSLNNIPVKANDHAMLRADYHGCLATVTKSKCPSYVGLTGIIIQETKNTFKIITKDDKIKTLPKENCVFTFIIDDIQFTMYGKHFAFRPADRATKKFTSKPTLDF
ncbi:unnamed protein product [Owenia fusiformis]|uniref:Ribonuclease P protein subunit p29 n=1 Tax=Owenia fusiformis TaxID=6347 RepID=A0A8J1UPV5_OWEFU|nr:unnamed protein product [Owenia fusiformis]